MSTSPRRASGVAPATDPFYVVKNKVVVQLRALRQDFDRWKVLLESTNTATNSDFKEVDEQLRGTARKIKVDLVDLSRTIDIVEKNRAKFKDIDDAELASRKKFVAETQAQIEAVRETRNSARVQAKLEADGAKRTQTAFERDNQRRTDEYVASQRQQQQEMVAQQDLVLDDMSSALARLGDVAGAINTEVESQNNMIKEIDEELDQTKLSMDNVMQKINKVLNTSDRWKLCCIFWLTVTAAVLFFAIIYT